LLNKNKPCVELAIAAPSEDELGCDVRYSPKKDKKEIKEALDEWKTEGKLYLANHLLHGVWKK
jgi:hypothetical protein